MSYVYIYSEFALVGEPRVVGLYKLEEGETPPTGAEIFDDAGMARVVLKDFPAEERRDYTL